MPTTAKAAAPMRRRVPGGIRVVRLRPATTARAVAATIAANEPTHTATAPRSAARPAVVSIVLSPSSARKKATAAPHEPGAAAAVARPRPRRRRLRHVHTAKPRNSSPAPTAMARSGTASATSAPTVTDRVWRTAMAAVSASSTRTAG